MSKIKDIKAREILDSRGNPTIECDILLSNNSFGRASVPSGASKGKHEAVELRDSNSKRYNGKGVENGIKNILDILKPKLMSKDFNKYQDFDNEIIKLDGTKNKSKMGANATLALSLAFAKSLASYSEKHLYEYLS